MVWIGGNGGVRGGGVCGGSVGGKVGDGGGRVHNGGIGGDGIGAGRDHAIEHVLGLADQRYVLGAVVVLQP